jgi:Flp pilus assembly protein TadD
MDCRSSIDPEIAMADSRRIPAVVLLCTVALGFVGCASQPPTHPQTIAEEDFRDADLDVIFATEFPVTSKADALQRAQTSLAEGEIDRGLFFYVKALNFEPDDTHLLYRIGRIHDHSGNAEMATRAYTLALGANPDFVPALESRGLLLLANKEDDRARQDLVRAVVLDASAWRAHNGLGLIEDRNGNHAMAIGHYTAALDIKPGVAEILNNRGYSRMLAGRYGVAEADLRQSAAHGYQKAWINLGVLMARNRQYGEAVDAFNEVLAEPESLNKAAEIAIENRDHEVAQRLLEKAIEESPMYFPEAEQNLAQLAAEEF